jgi:hypothetical protein
MIGVRTTTTQTFAAWRALTRLLSEAAWPAHQQVPGLVPVVYLGEFGSPPLELAASSEYACVLSTVEVPEQSWASMGEGGRNEQFEIPVIVSTNVPGLDVDELMVRLEELCGVVETVVRESGWRHVDKPHEFERANNSDGTHLHSWEVVRPRPHIYSQGDGQGYAGTVDIYVRVVARI